MPHRVVRLIVEEPCGDTLLALDALRNDAQSGRLVGAAIVGMYRGGDYVVDTCGVALHNRVTAIGMVEMLCSRLKAEELGL